MTLMKRRQFAVSTFGQVGEPLEPSRPDNRRSPVVPHHHRLIVVWAENRDQAESRGRADFVSNHPEPRILSCLVEEIRTDER